VRSPLRARLAALAALLVIAGCSTPGAAATPPAGASGDATILVVASTTVFADMVRNVGGDFVTVSSLVPPNGDVHTFSPRPSDIRNLAAAHLVVMNGLGLDDWLTRIEADASTREARRELQVWNSPLVVILFLFLVSLDCYVRKRQGLA